MTNEENITTELNGGNGENGKNIFESNIINTFRDLNDYSKYFPKKIKDNVIKEKYEILKEIKKLATLKKNTSYNITSIIKWFNAYEIINTEKHKSFHFYIFMIKYLWNSFQNKHVSPNLKTYICQVISNILKNIKKYILYNFFFDYDQKLLQKDNGENCKQCEEDIENKSDVTDNSYIEISGEYFKEYETVIEESDIESSINEGNMQSLSDLYYVTDNGIYEKNEEVDSFLNNQIIINGMDESFRFYIQKRIFDIIDYNYLFGLLYDYLIGDVKSSDGSNQCSHNVYKNYIGSVLSILINLKNFCYYNKDVHNLLLNFSFNNLYPTKYEEYKSMIDTQRLDNTQKEYENEPMELLVNKKMDENVNKECKKFAHDKKKNSEMEIKETKSTNNNNNNEGLKFNIDVCQYNVEDLEICIRYNTIFLNIMILSQLSSDDLCYKLIKDKKLLYLYKKVKKFNWHSINFSFVKIIYRGLKYSYLYNIDVENEIREIFNILLFLFLFYIKLPSNIQINACKYHIPDEYSLLINYDDSVIKLISKIFVYLLNKKYVAPERKDKNGEKTEKIQSELIDIFLDHLNDNNFSVNGPEGLYYNDDIGAMCILKNVDIYDFINVINSLFIPHIHPSNVGKHVGNISIFINHFLYSFIRKLKRENLYLKKINSSYNNDMNKNINSSLPNNWDKKKECIFNYINNYFITEEDKNFVVEKFTELAIQGMFPKSIKGTSLFENILKHLCTIDVNCLDAFIKKILEGLINVNISTQICNCLFCLCLLLPLLIKYKSKYLKDILYVMNMGIDICDIYKSFTIFSFLSILFSYIPIIKINRDINEDDYKYVIAEYKKFENENVGIDHFNGNNDDNNLLFGLENIIMNHSKKYLTDQEIKLLIKERKEFVDYLCYWVYEFFDKILYFIKYTQNEQPKGNKKQNSESKEEKLENDLHSGLKTTIISLFIRLDHDISYELCLQFLNNIDQENSKALSMIPYAIGMIKNRKIFDTVFNAFYKMVITKKQKKVTSVSDCADNEKTKNMKEGKCDHNITIVYSRNEYSNDDTVKCYLHFLANFIRRANKGFVNEEEIYKLIEIYILEKNNSVFKYVCKIIYRFLEYKFNFTVKNYSNFEINEIMDERDKIASLASWCVPWHKHVFMGKQNNENNTTTTKLAEDIAYNNLSLKEKDKQDIESLIKWNIPSIEDIKAGKKLIFLILDYIIDLLLQYNIPINTPNLVKYIEERNLKNNKFEWKFTLDYLNIISRIYKLIKAIIKAVSTLYPDERYNYDKLLTKCHIIDTKLFLYIYIYISEIIIILSVHVLKLPEQVLEISSYVNYSSNKEGSKSCIKSDVNNCNKNDGNKKSIDIEEKENKIKLREIFFSNVINNREKDIKADAKMQRKLIKIIHFILLKTNDGDNANSYNEYINSVLSFTYNIYPFSFNYDIIKSQYVNNIFYLFNERLKQRKKNYSFTGFREQLCNILFFINLSIYSQVRTYAQNTIKTILPTFKIIKVPFLNICYFYLKNYVILYTNIKGTQKETCDQNNDLNEKDSIIEIVQINSGEIDNVPNKDECNANINKLQTLKSFNDLNNSDYFENKCISCFNSIIITISNNSGLIKKISADMSLLKKYIKVIINILRLEIEKEDIKLKCMKFIYSIINNRFIKEEGIIQKRKKNSTTSSSTITKHKSKDQLFLFLKKQIEHENNNVYTDIVILSFFICFNDFAIKNYLQFYFNYLLENLSIKKNVNVYNLAFLGFVKLLRSVTLLINAGMSIQSVTNPVNENEIDLATNQNEFVFPEFINSTFKSENIYHNFVEICIYKNLKSKKKNNSINSIIINLSKVQKSFKGFAQINESHLKDFYSYYIFFKFLVKLQNSYNGIIENDTSEINSTDNITTSSKVSNCDDSINYIGKIIPILKKLQMDEHVDNEYKSTLISLICPLLLALRKFKNEKERCKIITDLVALMESEISIVNMEVFNFWLYYFHLLFINIKKKYINIYEKLFDFCLNFHFKDASSLVVKKKTQLLNIMITYSIHKNNHLIDKHIINYLKLINNDNMTTRQIIGDLLTCILYVLYDNKYYNHLKNIYYNILLYLYNLSNNVVNYLQTEQDIHKKSTHIYTLETLAYLTINLFTNKCMYVINNISIQFLKMFILSSYLIDNFINGLANKAINCLLCPSLYLFRPIKSDLCNMNKIKCGNSILENEQNNYFNWEILFKMNENEDKKEEDFNKLLEAKKENFDKYMAEETNTLLVNSLVFLINKKDWKVRNSTLQFCFYFYSYYCIYYYNKKENAILLNIFISMLNDNYVEIQNISRQILSSVLCYYDNKTLEKFSHFFLNITKEHQKKSIQNPSHDNNIGKNITKIIDKKKNIAIYALISIVNSFPNFVPNWLPNILITVARMSNTTTHIIKKEIEKCIQNFLRTHKDEWEYKYKTIFTEDQLNILDMYRGGLNYFT
ncbi:conserved Plasmodium protein, unknown function [Plasmodium berghei]|uniref:Proteasome activator complex subunit 4, putative n=4 Tax=Plasmodium berghei TaxID=5821 RepID=A0A509B022_PLABA|nr:proteasome activator complex subunit 4, putative [Plasmodium berghei ANKA]CXJ17633.1 conserved Plasmodium protein, unknown function [Plasmodium berghei]SCN28429.1 conserved Plasmodium protein, unknown function [Plasmodium berghei]SCO62622.1 conserved Plasmodium protein, unknown function [Plasmodium berghei]SCO64181.1 conserved Plasmodium protein, unknown function [Plasmodium berghei]VUC58314.1 proteasome activator complex subunit 4, putative [Plasmodium berghei ANKA]|eukprot:XP_034424077.1 proteasome activator complex subunit 4, putative [Plasmodium berghei ANKA]